MNDTPTPRVAIVAHPAETFRAERHAENVEAARAVRQGQLDAARALAPALKTMGKPQRRVDPAKVLNKPPTVRRAPAEVTRPAAPSVDLLKA